MAQRGKDQCVREIASLMQSLDINVGERIREFLVRVASHRLQEVNLTLTDMRTGEVNETCKFQTIKGQEFDPFEQKIIIAERCYRPTYTPSIPSILRRMPRSALNNAENFRSALRAGDYYANLREFQYPRGYEDLRKKEKDIIDKEARITMEQIEQELFSAMEGMAAIHQDYSRKNPSSLEKRYIQATYGVPWETLHAVHTVIVSDSVLRGLCYPGYLRADTALVGLGGIKVNASVKAIEFILQFCKRVKRVAIHTGYNNAMNHCKIGNSRSKKSARIELKDLKTTDCENAQEALKDTVWHDIAYKAGKWLNANGKPVIVYFVTPLITSLGKMLDDTALPTRNNANNIVKGLGKELKKFPQRLGKLRVIEMDDVVFRSAKDGIHIMNYQIPTALAVIQEKIFECEKITDSQEALETELVDNLISIAHLHLTFEVRLKALEEKGRTHEYNRVAETFRQASRRLIAKIPENMSGTLPIHSEKLIKKHPDIQMAYDKRFEYKKALATQGNQRSKFPFLQQKERPRFEVHEYEKRGESNRTPFDMILEEILKLSQQKMSYGRDLMDTTLKHAVRSTKSNVMWRQVDTKMMLWYAQFINGYAEKDKAHMQGTTLVTKTVIHESEATLLQAHKFGEVRLIDWIAALMAFGRTRFEAGPGRWFMTEPTAAQWFTLALFWTTGSSNVLIDCTMSPGTRERMRRALVDYRNRIRYYVHYFTYDIRQDSEGGVARILQELGISLGDLSNVMSTQFINMRCGMRSPVIEEEPGSLYFGNEHMLTVANWINGGTYRGPYEKKINLPFKVPNVVFSTQIEKHQDAIAITRKMLPYLSAISNRSEKEIIAATVETCSMTLEDHSDQTRRVFAHALQTLEKDNARITEMTMLRLEEERKVKAEMKRATEEAREAQKYLVTVTTTVDEDTDTYVDPSVYDGACPSPPRKQAGSDDEVFKMDVDVQSTSQIRTGSSMGRGLSTRRFTTDSSEDDNPGRPEGTFDHLRSKNRRPKEVRPGGSSRKPRPVISESDVGDDTSLPITDRTVFSAPVQAFSISSRKTKKSSRHKKLSTSSGDLSAMEDSPTVTFARRVKSQDSVLFNVPEGTASLTSSGSLSHSKRSLPGTIEEDTLSLETPISLDSPTPRFIADSALDSTARTGHGKTPAKRTKRVPQRDPNLLKPDVQMQGEDVVLLGPDVKAVTRTFVNTGHTENLDATISFFPEANIGSSEDDLSDEEPLENIRKKIQDEETLARTNSIDWSKISNLTNEEKAMGMERPKIIGICEGEHLKQPMSKSSKKQKGLKNQTGSISGAYQSLKTRNQIRSGYSEHNFLTQIENGMAWNPHCLSKSLCVDCGGEHSLMLCPERGELSPRYRFIRCTQDAVNQIWAELVKPRDTYSKMMRAVQTRMSPTFYSKLANNMSRNILSMDTEFRQCSASATELLQDWARLAKLHGLPNGINSFPWEMITQLSMAVMRVDSEGDDGANVETLVDKHYQMPTCVAMSVASGMGQGVLSRLRKKRAEYRKRSARALEGIPESEYKTFREGFDKHQEVVLEVRPIPDYTNDAKMDFEEFAKITEACRFFNEVVPKFVWLADAKPRFISGGPGGNDWHEVIEKERPCSYMAGEDFETALNQAAQPQDGNPIKPVTVVVFSGENDFGSLVKFPTFPHAVVDICYMPGYMYIASLGKNRPTDLTTHVINSERFALFDTGTVANMKLKEAWELFVRPSEERKTEMGQAHDAAVDAFMTMELFLAVVKYQNDHEEIFDRWCIIDIDVETYMDLIGYGLTVKFGAPTGRGINRLMRQALGQKQMCRNYCEHPPSKVTLLDSDEEDSTQKSGHIG